MGEIPSLKTMAGGRQHSGMPTLLAVQLVGWMALMAQCFYWTEWIGDYQVGPIRVAFLGLAAGAALSIVTTIFLPALNDRIGTVNVWLCGEVSFAVCMVVTPFIPR